MKRLLGGLVVLLLVTGCDAALPVTSAATPQAGGPQPGDAAAWAGAMCQAVDQLDQAVGDPTTGRRSTAWQEFETALTSGDEERLKAAANGVLGHLTEGSRAAATATSLPVGPAAASRMQALLEGLAEGVRTLRDGTLEGSIERVNDGRRQIDAAYENHYEQALGQLAEVPLGTVSLPCR